MPKGRTVFLDENLQAHPDQWAFLEGIRRVSEQQLDQIIERNGMAAQLPTPEQAPTARNGLARETLGLRPCAQRMLQAGVSANQRVTCFRLAVQLRKAGLPYDYTLAVLDVWARRNNPADGKTIITPGEIMAQTQSAYGDKQYRACGCEDETARRYCDSSCPVRREATAPHNGSVNG